MRKTRKKEAVLEGSMTINKAYQLTQEKRQAQEKGRAVFNRTNDNIEWATWTWNPVTGCKHGCSYCYAKDIAARFYGEGGFEPKFHPDGLSALANTKPPKTSESIRERNVFVCSMADLFGDWVPQEWIDQVMTSVRDNPQWNYLFLTKNPKRYLEIDWPTNTWAGATADTFERYHEAIKTYGLLSTKDHQPSVTFLSCEPLLEYIDMDHELLQYVDWIIIGGQSKTSKCEAKQPKWHWVERILFKARIADCRVYFKPNLEIRPKEYPGDLSKL